MKFKLGAMTILLSVVAFAIPGRVNADAYNKKTIVTFTAPVEIPGVGAQVLPAGTYVIKVVDSVSSRDIIQIFNKEETHVYATIITIPNYRLKVTGQTVITFKERAAGAPEALKAWFYPGNSIGQEFVYPKARAIEIAKETHEPVLTMPTELAPQIVAPAKPAEPPVEALKEAPIKAVEPSGEEVEIAQVIPPVLPKTGSSLPLVGLTGLIMLASAFVLFLLRNRMSRA